MPQLMRMESPAVLEVWRHYYEADATYDHTGTFDCPPIRRVVAVHGVNVPTEVLFALRIRTARLKPTAVQTRFSLDDEAELVPSTPALLKMEGGIVREMPEGDALCGDGVVPLCSMEHCKDWSGRLDLKVIHLDGAEHRAMLADPRFHLAIREALTPDFEGSGGAGSRSSTEPGKRKKPPVDYSIAGTWSDWSPSPMDWDGNNFFFIAKIGKQGWESFQILLRGSWDAVIYPSVKNASPSVEHTLRGPDNLNKGLDWTIGRPGFNPLHIGAISPGTEYKIILVVDERGHAASVTWELHLKVQSFAKAEVCRWQASKNDREWWDFPEDVSRQLSSAKASGLPMVKVEIGRGFYEVDLRRMVQRNLATGTERAVRALLA